MLQLTLICKPALHKGDVGQTSEVKLLSLETHRVLRPSFTMTGPDEEAITLQAEHAE